MGKFLVNLKKKLEWRAERRRMMQQYRQDYVPPYAPSEDPPEEVMAAMAEEPVPEESAPAQEIQNKDGGTD